MDWMDDGVDTPETIVTTRVVLKIISGGLHTLQSSGSQFL